MTPDGFDPHRAIPGTTHATPEQQRAWAEQQATQIADAVFPAGGGVVSTPNDTLRAHLEAIRDERNAVHKGDPFEAYVVSMGIVSAHAMQALEILDDAPQVFTDDAKEGVVIRDAWRYADEDA